MGLLYRGKALEPAQRYSPNIFIQSGLFLLTCVIITAAYLLLMLMTSFGGGESTMRTTFIIWGLLSWIGLWIFTQKKLHKHSGVDDALNWMGIAYLGLGLTGWNNAMPNDVAALVWAGLCGVGALLTADRILSLVSFALLLLTLYYASQNVHEIGMLCMGVFSLLVYWLAVQGVAQARFPSFKGCLEALTYGALAGLYASLNYYVADTSGYGNLHFTWGFAVTTALIPIAYLTFGMVEKNRALLDIGALCLAAAVLTFRYYHHLLPVEAALSLAGAALILTSWGLIRYLREPKHGFTSAKDPDSSGSAIKVLQVAQALAVNQSFGAKPAPDNSSGTEFGGGSFGGGGAGDSW